MKIEDFVERVGGDGTTFGRIIEYLKDGIVEMELENENHITTSIQDIELNQRQYSFPTDMIKVLDIQIRGHQNNDDEYRSIPRMVEPPVNKDDEFNQAKTVDSTNE